MTVETGEDSVTITVADDGPGIEENELSIIEEGTETPLRHGSGFALALIAWGTDIAGGSVSFEANESTGTVVTIDAPTLSGPDPATAASADDG